MMQHSNETDKILKRGDALERMYYFIEIKDQIKEVLNKDPSELDKHTL